MNCGAIRLIALSTLLRPGRISSRPASMPAMARATSTVTSIPLWSFISSANSPRISGVSQAGGASSMTVTLPRQLEACRSFHR